MKKYKALSRIFLLSYLEIIFCGVLFGLLLVKFNLALALACIGIMVLDLADLIVAKHMFKNNYLVFFIMSIVGIALINISFLGALVIESIFTAGGKAAPYAWLVLGFSFAFVPVIDTFFVLSIQKIHHQRLVEEGIIEADKEEDI